MPQNDPILAKPKQPRNIADILPNIKETPNQYRYTLLDQEKFDKRSFRYKTITNGVSIIVACEKDKFVAYDSQGYCEVGLKAQGLRFDKSLFSLSTTADWIARHTKDVPSK